MTRACLEVCDEFRHPVGIITKSALVRRDVELLARLARRGGARVALSIPFANDDDARRIEPFASAASTRFETLRRLAEAGIEVGVALAPLIPGLNDSQVSEILERAAAAGARSAFLVLLRLAAEVRPVFEERLRVAYPERAEKVLSALREMRGGVLYKSGFGERMRGEGPRWEAVRTLFEIQCRRLGLERNPGFLRAKHRRLRGRASSSKPESAWASQERRAQRERALEVDLLDRRALLEVRQRACHAAQRLDGARREGVARLSLGEESERRVSGAKRSIPAASRSALGQPARAFARARAACTRCSSTAPRSPGGGSAPSSRTSGEGSSSRRSRRSSNGPEMRRR